MGRVYLMTAMS